jgi:hypothetical protein
MTILRRLREHGAAPTVFGAGRTPRAVNAAPLFGRQSSPTLTLINEGAGVCLIEFDVSNANLEPK